MAELVDDVLTVHCGCSNLHHAVRFTFHNMSPHDRGQFEAYVDVSLDYEIAWWRRLRVALRYLFRRVCLYGDASEIVIRDQDLPKIRAWVERAEREVEARNRAIMSSGSKA